MTAPAHLALVPRDGFFCKDGRDWQTSASNRGHGLHWPWPSTVLGALRSAWGRGLEERQGQALEGEEWRVRTSGITLGRSLVLRRRLGGAWSQDDRVWPVPSDAVWLEAHGEVHRLDPRPPALPTLGRTGDDTLEALWVAAPADLTKPRMSPPWWSERAFATWLAGGLVPATAPEDLPAPGRRLQAHVGIRPETLTAEEEILYSHDVVETLERNAEWAVGVAVTLPEAERPALAGLGSDARLARVEGLPPETFDPPPAVLEAFRAGSRGLRLMVVTPAGFEGGWLPDGFRSLDGLITGRLPVLDAELILRAAMVGRPVPVSGWDVAARRPKPVARMVPPGAVYFLERTDGGPFAEPEARALWLAAIGARLEEGYGRLVPGTWNPDWS